MRKVAQLTLSLETPVGDEEDAAFGDLIENSNASDPADVISGIIANESLGKVLKAMDERERKIVELRFGLKGERPRTLAEVSSRFQVSRERIRQIEVRALARIKATPEIQALMESS